MPDNVTISEDYRNLTVPQDQLILGCVGDAWVRRVYFTAPRYCDGTDLSGYDFTVQFINEAGVSDLYEVEDLSTDTNTLTFSWIVSPIACAVLGSTQVSVIASNVDGETGDVLNRFVTTTYDWKVLPSTKAEGGEAIEAASYVETMIAGWQADIDTMIASANNRNYDTVADMQADTTLSAGMICHTLGFHAAGDGGAAWYKVEATGTANGMDVLDCGNVNAHLLNVNASFENVACYGTKADEPESNTDIIAYVIEKNKGGKIYFPKGEYSVSEPIKTYQGKDNFTDLIFDENAIVKASEQMQYLLHIGGIEETLAFEAGYKKYLKGGIFDATSNVTVAAVMIENAVKDIDMSDCVILANASDDNYDMSGIVLGSDSTVSQDAYLHNITVENKASSGISGSGIVINSNDNTVRDCRVYYFLVNVSLVGNTTFLESVHTLAYPNVNDDVSIRVNSDCVFITNCYSDSESVFLDVVKTGAYVYVDNCQYYSYQNRKLTFTNVTAWARLLFNNVVYFAARGESDVKNVGINVPVGYIARTIAESSFSNNKIDSAENVEDGDLLKNNESVIFYNTNLLASNANWVYCGTYNVIANTWNNLVFTIANRTIQVPIWNTLTESGNLYTDIGSAVAIGGRDNNATYTIGFVFDLVKKRVSVYVSCTHTRMIQEIKLLGSSGGISNEFMRYHELTTVSQEPTFAVKYQIIGSSGAISQIS